jgi:hypothetical protein
LDGVQVLALTQFVSLATWQVVVGPVPAGLEAVQVPMFWKPVSLKFWQVTVTPPPEEAAQVSMLTKPVSVEEQVVVVSVLLVRLPVVPAVQVAEAEGPVVLTVVVTPVLLTDSVFVTAPLDTPTLVVAPEMVTPGPAGP